MQTVLLGAPSALSQNKAYIVNFQAGNIYLSSVLLAVTFFLAKTQVRRRGHPAGWRGQYRWPRWSYLVDFHSLESAFQFICLLAHDVNVHLIDSAE